TPGTRGSMSSLTTTRAPKGLEGVVATTSSICYIDGEQGVLAYRGIDIHELADNSTFEETCYLLWFGRLPRRNELKELQDRLAEERKLDGSQPSPTAERALDIALILHADHELNASTFAARVTAATLSDMHSAVTSAIGALKGPLHGGANEAVFHILEMINSSNADPVEYVKGMLAQKKKIPGFGHRVYHTEDPRATHLRKMSRDL